MILLESSALIEASRKNGRGDIRARVKHAILSGKAALCSPVYFELLNGARGAKETEYLKQLRKTLHFLPCTENEWSLAAKLIEHFRKKGLTILGFDILIYAIAKNNQADILTMDKDFIKIYNNLPK